MAYRTTNGSSSGTGTGNNPATTVPSGIAANDIAILAFSADDSTPGTVTWPTGFTELHNQITTLDGQYAAIAWKRCTGSESGSFTISTTTIGGASPWIAVCALFSGRHLTDPPVATEANSNVNDLTVEATGVTAIEGDDLCMVSCPDVSVDGAGTGHTTPTDFTERLDVENGFQNVGVFTRDNVSAGATGNVIATFSVTSGNAGWAAFLVRIPSTPAAGGDATRTHHFMLLGVGS